MDLEIFRKHRPVRGVHFWLIISGCLVPKVLAVVTIYNDLFFNKIWGCLDLVYNQDLDQWMVPSRVQIKRIVEGFLSVLWIRRYLNATLESVFSDLYGR